MTADWFNLASFLLIYSLAIISPGPNFIMVANTSLAGSRRVALLAALGVAVGSGIFALAGMLGLIVLVKTLPYFRQVMPFIGGGYLGYLGICMVRDRHAGVAQASSRPAGLSTAPLFSAFRTGLLTNLTNPKAWAFYISLFTVIIAPGYSVWMKALLVVLMFLISLSWYAFVVLLITNSRIRPLFHRFRPSIQTILGLFLLLLGVRLLFVG